MIRQHGNKFSHGDFLSAVGHANSLERDQRVIANTYICELCGDLHVGRGERHGQYMFEQEFRFEW